LLLTLGDSMSLKPDPVVITSITSTSGPKGGASVFGLGDDQLVYVWDNASHQWRLWTS
jgi:hypothetical protein